MNCFGMGTPSQHAENSTHGPVLKDRSFEPRRQSCGMNEGFSP